MANDPLAAVKLMAATYGIPPEAVEAGVNGILDFTRGAAEAQHADIVAHLLTGADAASRMGEAEIAAALISEVRGLLGLSFDPPDGGEEVSQAAAA